MSGSKVNDFSIGDSNIQSVMLTLDKTFKGLHQVSLTNYDSTSESQIAAGSVIECGGALYKFDSNESITGSPSDGTVYIRLVPDGDTITAEYTDTAPTWSDSKQGWYGTSTDANKRYLEFAIQKDSTKYSKILLSIFDVQKKKETYITLSEGDIGTKTGGPFLVQITSTFDNIGEWSNSTYRFTPINEGYYNVNGFWDFVTGAGVVAALGYRINSGSYVYFSSHGDSGSGWETYNSFSFDLYMNSGDYLEFYNSGGGGTNQFNSRLKKINIKKINVL